MAKQTITLLTDDLNGGEADETVTFALDGVGYTIDLSSTNAQKLRDLLGPYRDAGLRTGRTISGPETRRTGAYHPNFTANRELNNKIREWAGKNGWPIAERGRIPQAVVDAYHRGAPNPDAPTLISAKHFATPAAEPEPVKQAPAKKAAPTRRRAASKV